MQLSYKIGIVLVLTLGALASRAGGLDSLRVEKNKGQYFVIHQVEKGETLYSLARRYGADLEQVVKVNDIKNNQISLGQELKLPIDKSKARQASDMKPVEQKASSGTEEVVHTVMQGETLYSISRKYGVAVEDMKKWNSLPSNEISIDQQLTIRISDDQAVPAPVEVKKPVKETPKPKSTVPPGFTEYYVQSGDLLETIAAKFKVKPDSIVFWNHLPNAYLSIGQKLLVRGKPDSVRIAQNDAVEILPYGQRKTVKDQSGFTRVFEEGTARKIEDGMETQKYLALHRTLSVGALIEVRNLMNNQKIFVRVVGKLPETGLNENVMIRLTPICFERLGVIDPKTRVEVSYYLD